jgi:hypothetical protein
MVGSIRKSVETSFEKELTHGKRVRALGLDRQEFLVGVASNKEGLVKLLNNRNVVRVILVNTIKGSIFFDLFTGIVKVNEYMLEERNIIEYETKQLLLVAGASARKMINEIKDNNEVVLKMADYFKDKVDLVSLDKVLIKYSSIISLPLFANINIKNDGLDLAITKHQMSVLTGCGIVKIHNLDRTITSLELARIFSKLFGVDVNECNNMIISVNGKGLMTSGDSK